MTENTFDNIKDEHANIEEDAEYDHIGTIESREDPVKQENISEYKNNTKSISSTIDEILSQDLPAYSLDMYEPNSANQLHKCGEFGAGYIWKKHVLRHIRNKHEGVKYSCNQCEN